ncbi:MAG: SIS domain-containing protein [Treponema sp.]|jgi:6-phospho-3-hexuloisomerase|nr:SIS domain-containing protein [Treponema sp.]
MELFDIILKEIAGVLEQVDAKELDAALNCLDKKHRVFVDGEGRSGLMAKGFAMRLMHLGYTVYVVGETITPALAKDDLFIGVSGSGTGANVINDAAKARKSGCRLLAVTGKPGSPLAEAADAVLCVPGTVKGDTGEDRGSIQLLSSLFDQSLHLVLDTLCLMVSRRDATGNDTATGGHW